MPVLFNATEVPLICPRCGGCFRAHILNIVLVSLECYEIFCKGCRDKTSRVWEEDYRKRFLHNQQQGV